MATSLSTHLLLGFQMSGTYVTLWVPGGGPNLEGSREKLFQACAFLPASPGPQGLLTGSCMCFNSLFQVLTRVLFALCHLTATRPLCT